MRKEELRNRLDKALMAYIRAFEIKHDGEFDICDGDDLMGILIFGDYAFNISDIVFDIENNLPENLIFDWFNDMIDNKKNPSSAKMNLANYAKGLRFEDLQSNTDVDETKN